MNRRIEGTGESKPFSFIDFYSRRVRRIFPSLIFCLLTFLVLGWFVLLPDEYSLFGKHTMGASAYVSNLLLWSEAGDYFQTASQTKPLLHLWSLGIEEQFYLICRWPGSPAIRVVFSGHAGPGFTAKSPPLLETA